MKRWLHATSNDDWSPYSTGTYRVQGGDYDIKNTDNPKVAISTWFRLSKKYPTGSIMCAKKDEALALLKVATPELLTGLQEKYGCPYKLDYMIEAVEKKISDNCRGFYEGQYGYGDSIHPFSVG